MIAGTFIFEDTQLHWRYNQEKRLVELRVCDGLTGEERVQEVAPRAFAASVALAIDPDGGDGWDAQGPLYREAEGIQPPNGPMRWIP